MKYFVSLAMFTLVMGFWTSKAQAPVVIDKVIANVGNHPILLSELEVRFNEEKLYMAPNEKKAKCDLLYRIIQEKLMLVKAERDSIIVTNEEVDGQLNQRINYFAQQLGGEEELEKYFNKSMVEIKADLRTTLREQLIVQQVRSMLLGDVSVTPSEVKKYFNSIPKDSLPTYNTEVRLGQIVRYPRVGDREKDRAKRKLLRLRKQILAGKMSFGEAALLNSDDLGSQVDNGDLGWRNRGDFVPEFSAAAFRLQKDSLSGVVETQFGLHLIKLLDRRGDNIHCAHILIKPRITRKDEERVMENLDSVRNIILNDTFTFEECAYEFSQDPETKNNGGLLVDPQSGGTRIPAENLPQELFYAIDKMKVGTITMPIEYQTRDGRKAYRIIKLMEKVPSHTANLKTDYSRISQLAKGQKTNQVLNEWTNNFIPSVYFRIDEEYNGCGKVAAIVENIEKFN